MDRRDATQPSVEAAPDGVSAESGEVLYFVMIQHYSLWRPFIRTDGSQAVATTLEHAEALLVEAKQHIAKHSSKGKLAAAGLRLAMSRTDEL